MKKYASSRGGIALSTGSRRCKRKRHYPCRSRKTHKAGLKPLLLLLMSKSLLRLSSSHCTSTRSTRNKSCPSTRQSPSPRPSTWTSTSSGKAQRQFIPSSQFPPSESACTRSTSWGISSGEARRASNRCESGRRSRTTTSAPRSTTSTA